MKILLERFFQPASKLSVMAILEKHRCEAPAKSIASVPQKKTSVQIKSQEKGARNESNAQEKPSNVEKTKEDTKKQKNTGGNVKTSGAKVRVQFVKLWKKNK